MHNLTLPLSTRQESMSTRGRSESMSFRGRLESMSTRGRQDSMSTAGAGRQRTMSVMKMPEVFIPNTAKWRSQIGTLQMYESLPGRRRTGVPTSYEGTQELDKRRKLVLRDGRTVSPIDTILRFDKLRQTVLFSVLRSPVTWIVSGTYVASSVCARTGYFDAILEDLDRSSFEGADLLVTFMIIFYVCRLYYTFQAPDLSTY